MAKSLTLIILKSALPLRISRSSLCALMKYATKYVSPTGQEQIVVRVERTRKHKSVGK